MKMLKKYATIIALVIAGVMIAVTLYVENTQKAEAYQDYDGEHHGIEKFGEYGRDELVKYYDFDENVICYSRWTDSDTLSCVKDN